VRALAALAAVLATAIAVQAGDDTELLFPAGNAAARLRLEITARRESPDRAWQAFLDRLFDYFDRDGDGQLSPAEAGRVFPLPLSGGREVALDFAALDTDKDGKGSRAEFRAYYRSRGFMPVVTLLAPAPPEALALGEALFRHLDRDGDGRLTAAELRQIPSLLRRFDEDEDEVLTAAELLAHFPPGAVLKPVGLRIATPKDKAPASAVLRLPIGVGRPAIAGGDNFQLSAAGSSLKVPGGVCTVTVAADDPLAGFRAARGFYLAQFKDTAGDGPATKKMFEDDAAAGVLAGLFDAADRNGDGKLTRAELEAFFDLVELGVQCQVVVNATDRGRNLFDRVDANADGRLDLDELTRAGRVLPDELARTRPLDRSAVPASYRLVVGRGPVAGQFGPVPFGAAAKRKPAAATPAARGPRWFRAMDRNGDGYVSRQEFVGSPELFAKLDSDGDGRISPEEAERADSVAGRGGEKK
jgi:Ca2+-binding EF-hand superfamily protein